MDEFLDIGTLSLVTPSSVPASSAPGGVTDEDDEFPALNDADARAAAYTPHTVASRPLDGYPAINAVLSGSARPNRLISDDAPATVTVSAEETHGSVTVSHEGEEGDVETAMHAWTHLFSPEQQRSGVFAEVLSVLRGEAPVVSAHGGTDDADPEAFQQSPMDAESAARMYQESRPRALDALRAMPAELQESFQDALRSTMHAYTLPSTPAAVTAAPAEQRAVQIAVCQMHGVPMNPHASLRRVASVLRAAAGVHVCVCPESFLAGYHIGPDALRATAVELPTPDEYAAAVLHPPRAALAPSGHASPVIACACVCRCTGVALVLPFTEMCNGALYNSVAVFDPDGSIVQLYRKCHLWGRDYEKRVFVPGPGDALDLTRYQTKAVQALNPSIGGKDPFHPFVLSSHPGVPMGVLICFDNEFPEPARLLARRGCKLVFSVMASGEAEGFTSTCVIPTRAAENHMCYVYCNYPSCPPPAVAEEACPGAITVRYNGGSGVFAPTGRPIAALPSFALQPERRAPWAGRPAFQGGVGFDQTEQDNVRRELARGLDEDEHVLIACFNPDLDAYVRDAERNPYLEDRRHDLYDDGAAW